MTTCIDSDDDDFQHHNHQSVSIVNNINTIKSTSMSAIGQELSQQEQKQMQCPICQRHLPACFNEDQVTMHVNKCIDGKASPSPKKQSIQLRLNIPTATMEVKEQEPVEVKVEKEELIVIESSSEVCIVDIKSEQEHHAQEQQIEKKRSAAEEWKEFFRNVRTRAGLTFGYGFTNAQPLADITNTSTSSAPAVDVEKEDKPRQTKKKSTTNNGSPVKEQLKRVCPFYKKMPGTQFVVDAFSYGKIPNVTGYFLTHFHADHYMGLTSKFNFGTIYCSEVTANLVLHQIKVDRKYIRILPINETTKLENGITVHLINANHCPGSVLMYFNIPMPAPQPPLVILHTGDFRASRPMHVMHPMLRNGPVIDLLYLDTTYCKPQYKLPPQDLMIYNVGELCKSVHDSSLSISNSSSIKKVLFVCGTYLIGKERVFIEISKRLKSKIYADRRKTGILKCENNPYLEEQLTDELGSAQVHVIQMNKIHDIQFMQELLESVKDKYDRILAFKPTGWAHTSSTSKGMQLKIPNWLQPSLSRINSSTDNALKVTAINDSGNVVLISIPYSEHSSYDELEMFVKGVRAKKIIPTVNIGTEAVRSAMQRTFALWKSTSK